MKEIHFVVPSEVINRLSQRFALRHKSGHHGYFGTLTENELWAIVRSLVNSGYRVDIKPGVVIKLMARKET
jgi:hypothetical protein